jgi:hypothetical protein
MPGLEFREPSSDGNLHIRLKFILRRRRSPTWQTPIEKMPHLLPKAQ